MTAEHGDIPEQYSEWKAPVEASEPHSLEKKTNQLPEILQPTPENPIKRVQIGIDREAGIIMTEPTRVVITLQDGQKAEIPWSQAEKMLPPEFKAFRELAGEVQRTQNFVTGLGTAIRLLPGLMTSSRVKSAARIFTRKYAFEIGMLGQITSLSEQSRELSNSALLQLRALAGEPEMPILSPQEGEQKLRKIRQQFFRLRDEVFARNKEVKRNYENYIKGFESLPEEILSE